MCQRLQDVHFSADHRCYACYMARSADSEYPVCDSNSNQVTVVFGISCFLLHYGVFVEDLGNVLRIALRLVFYLTGVFWNIMSRLPAPYNNYIGKGNPIAFLITSMRQCVIYGQAPHRKLLLLWFLIGLVLCALGIRKIYKSENSYVKVI